MRLSAGGSITVHLQPDGGETKSIDSRNLGTFTNLDMDIVVTLIDEVHGFLDGENTQCASLIVLRFNLASRHKTRRFWGFRPTITVRNDPGGLDDGKAPWITDCFEPKGTVYVNELSSKRTKVRSRKAALKISPPEPIPLSGDLSLSQDDSEEWKEIYRYTVQGSLREKYPGRRNKMDQIYWNVKQEGLIRTGIDMLQVAFLVLREPGYNLELKVALDADVDYKWKVGKGWKEFWRVPSSVVTSTISVYEDNAPADPTLSMDGDGDNDNATAAKKLLRRTTVPNGIDQNNLRKLEGSSRPAFLKLAGVHDIEAMEAWTYYDKGMPVNEHRHPGPMAFTPDLAEQEGGDNGDNS